MAEQLGEIVMLTSEDPTLKEVHEVIKKWQDEIINACYVKLNSVEKIIINFEITPAGVAITEALVEKEKPNGNV